MKKLILSICLVGFVGFVGCGNNFLGLEDYQRDILGVLIGQQSASDGLNCWDLSGDGVCDAEEDWTGPEGVSDGVCDALDCQGQENTTTIIEGEGSCTTLCHCNNQGECHTLVVPAPAVQNHLGHDDFCGPCEE